MRWLARLALSMAVLAFGMHPGPDGSAFVAVAMAESGGKQRSDRDGASEKTSGKSDKTSGKADKGSGKGSGKNSSKSGKDGKSAGAGKSDKDSGGSGRVDVTGVPQSVAGPEPAAEPAEPEPGGSDPGAPAPVDVVAPTTPPGESGADPDPVVPVEVDAPAPGDPDPDPAAPVEAGDPDPEPILPVRVDDPAPAAGGGSDDALAGTPDAGGAEPADTPEGSTVTGADDPNLEVLLERVFRRKRVTSAESDVSGGGATDVDAIPSEAADSGAAGLEPAPVATPPAPAVAEVPVEAPAATSPAARTADPVDAGRAPRIALSSGGGGATYRQHEISVLGLTPRARQVVGALGFRILSERRSPLLGNRIVAKLRTPGNQTAEAALARVRVALPDLTVDLAHLYRPSGEAAPVRYAAEMVGAPAPGACRVDARIGLIDSGVADHPTLARADITRRNFVDRNAATNVAHGTAIASILVGNLPGSGPLAPGAQIFSANVFAQDAGGLRADAPAIIEALDWMAAQRVPVVNLSLMGPSNALLEAAITAAAGRGQVLVAAAGNDGPGAAPAYPAAYPGVIAVAAVDARGRPYGRNNRGPYVYVSAPGVDVWGADARGGQAFWTGTSFAAPFVTATLARDVALGRARNVNDGRARIAASARDLGAPGRDPIYGHGLLQVGGCSGTGAPVISSRN